jgi:alcohol dehydrogenase class IV
MIDYALKFNVSAVPDRFKNMAMTLGLKGGDGASFIQWLKELKAAVGIPKNLKDAGVDRKHLGKLVEVATQDACHQNNPRTVKQEDFHNIFSEAF